MTSLFYSAFFNIHRSGVLTALAWLVPHESAAVSARSVYTIQPCTMSLHAKPHLLKVYACLAVTCHLHFWQDDRDLLRATAVTQGWNGYRNRSQHRSWLWRRKFSRRSRRDSNPATTFQSRVRRSNHWATPAPYEKCKKAMKQSNSGRKISLIGLNSVKMNYHNQKTCVKYEKGQRNEKLASISYQIRK